MGNKVSYFDVSRLDERRLIAATKAGPLPDLLRLVFSEEEREIYQLYRAGMSLSKIGQALQQPRAMIHRKLSLIKNNVRFLLLVKEAIQTLPRLIEDFCPTECPFCDRETS